MKKNIVALIIICMLLTINLPVNAKDKTSDYLNDTHPTYYYLLNKNNCDIFNYKIGYASYDDVNTILKVLLNKDDVKLTFSGTGYVYKKQFLSILANDFLMDTSIIENLKDYDVTYLTFQFMYETLDYFFKDIVEANGLRSEVGSIAFLDNSYQLLTEHGEAYYFDDFHVFYVNKDNQTVCTFFDDNILVEIVRRNIPINVKKFDKTIEIKGKMYYYDEYLRIFYLQKDGKFHQYNMLEEYPENSTIILDKINEFYMDKEVILKVGNYKKMFNIIASLKEE